MWKTLIYNNLNKHCVAINGNGEGLRKLLGIRQKVSMPYVSSVLISWVKIQLCAPLLYEESHKWLEGQLGHLISEEELRFIW